MFHFIIVRFRFHFYSLIYSRSDSFRFASFVKRTKRWFSFIENIIRNTCYVITFVMNLLLLSHYVINLWRNNSCIDNWNFPLSIWNLTSVHFWQQRAFWISNWKWFRQIIFILGHNWILLLLLIIPVQMETRVTQNRYIISIQVRIQNHVIALSSN